MRSIRYVSLGQEFPTQAPTNVAPLEEEGAGCTDMYQAVVRGVLLTALAAQTLAAQINAGSQGDELPQQATASAFDHDGWQYQPPMVAARYPQQPIADESTPQLYIISDEDGQLAVGVRPRWVSPSAFAADDEFVGVVATGVASDDESVSAFPARRFAALQPPALDTEFLPTGTAPAFVTDDGDTQVSRIVVRTILPFAPHEGFPQLSAPPPFAIDETDWTLPTLRYTAPIVAPAIVDEDFVAQQTPHVTTDDDGGTRAAAMLWPDRRAFFTPEEFPQFGAVSSLVTDDDTSLPFRRWQFRAVSPSTTDAEVLPGHAALFTYQGHLTHIAQAVQVRALGGSLLRTLGLSGPTLKVRRSK
jgi:hypothetical protein